MACIWLILRHNFHLSFCLEIFTTTYDVLKSLTPVGPRSARFVAWPEDVDTGG